MTAEPKFASGLGWPIAVLSCAPEDLECHHLSFTRGLDGLGEVDYAFIEDTPVGLVLFQQRVPYPEHGITIEVDSAISFDRAFDWLRMTFGFGPGDFTWKTELEHSPYLVSAGSPARG